MSEHSSLQLHTQDIFAVSIFFYQKIVVCRVVSSCKHRLKLIANYRKNRAEKSASPMIACSRHGGLIGQDLLAIRAKLLIMKRIKHLNSQHLPILELKYKRKKDNA